MTDIKKAKDKARSGTNAKKLALNKETLKDLSAPGAGKVKGGAQKKGLSPDLGCE